MCYNVRMHLGWLFNRFGDPHLRLSPEQRKRALDESTRALRNRLTVVTLLVVALPAFVAVRCVWLIDDWVVAETGLSLNQAHLAMLGAILLVLWPWSAWVYGRMYVRPYRKALRDLGVIVCVGCGYSMEALGREAQCPECGWEAA